MLAGKHFELRYPTLAIDVLRKREWITIPAGTIVRVIAGPNGEGDRMVDVLWERSPLVMFAIDLTAGGTEIREQVRAVGS